MTSLTVAIAAGIAILLTFGGNAEAVRSTSGYASPGVQDQLVPFSKKVRTLSVPQLWSQLEPTRYVPRARRMAAARELAHRGSLSYLADVGPVDDKLAGSPRGRTATPLQRDGQSQRWGNTSDSAQGGLVGEAPRPRQDRADASNQGPARGDTREQPLAGGQGQQPGGDAGRQLPGDAGNGGAEGQRPPGFSGPVAPNARDNPELAPPVDLQRDAIQPVFPELYLLGVTGLVRGLATKAGSEFIRRVGEPIARGIANRLSQHIGTVRDMTTREGLGRLFGTKEGTQRLKDLAGDIGTAKDLTEKALGKDGASKALKDMGLPPAQQPADQQQQGDQQQGDQQQGDQQQPADQQQGDQQQGDQQQGEQQPPVVVVPDEPGPGEQQPGDQQPGEQAPGEQQPGEQGPGEQVPGDQGPGEQVPGDQGPGEQAPAEPPPVEPVPVEPVPADPGGGGVEPAPVDPGGGGFEPAPADPGGGGVEPAPVDPGGGGVEPAPVDPGGGGFEPAPVDPGGGGFDPGGGGGFESCVCF